LPPKIVVVVPHDVAVTTLLATGALAELERRYELAYLASPSVALPLPAPSTPLAPRSLESRLGRALDFHFWNLSLFSYYRRQGLSASTSLKGATLPPGHRRAYHALSHPLPSRLLSLLDRRVFFARDAAFARFLRQQKPRLVIAPASAMDTYSHLAVRSAASLGIPSVMLVSHWDYFSKKGLLRVAPDRIYVWGEDMRRSAIERNGVDPQRLAIVGAPQFEKYLQLSSERRHAARGRFGIAPGARLLLFPGTSAPFDERVVLRILDHVIAADAALSDVRLLYRPHPRAWARRSAESIDPESLPRVTLDDPARPGGTSDGHYLDLMAAVDAVVSPFSTMTLEAALCGKPSLCTGFSDGVNSWDFTEASNSEHIRMLEGRRWLTICADRSRLAAMFRDFIAGLGEPGLAQRIRGEARSTVFYNHRSYAERLLEHVQADFG
jgi:hypothetical protein